MGTRQRQRGTEKESEAGTETEKARGGETWMETRIEMEIRRGMRQNRAGTGRHKCRGAVSERQGRGQTEEEQS